MIRRAASLTAAAALLLGALGGLGPAAAAAIPRAAWKLAITPVPANFAPGSTSRYFLVATNVGGDSSVGEVTLKTTLPDGLTPVEAIGRNGDPARSVDPTCVISAPTVTCTTEEAVHPGRFLFATITAGVPSVPEGPTADLQGSVGGGGAGEVATTSPTPIQADPVSFDFLAGAAGFSAPFNNLDGFPATQAGSHPYQSTFDLGFPVESINGALTGSGHLRDLTVDLPRGVIANPAATPVLCTEAELTSAGHPGCPDPSQLGVAVITTTLSGGTEATLIPSPIYNMVPPPGAVAEFGTEAANIGIFVHLIASVRSDGDYGGTSTTNDILAIGTNPIFNLQAQLWGEPSGSAHDQIRGLCNGLVLPPCKAAEQKTALLTMPSDCPGKPITFKAHADSWEEPTVEHEAEYANAELAGNPVSVEGCDELAFEPTIKVRPTTNLTDSPSGLDVDLHQELDLEGLSTALEGLSTANLKDATVTFPAGLSVNASQADGLAACTSEQIGLKTSIGATPIHFSKVPASCPDAAKLGTVEVSTPLLAQHDGEHKVLRDPETGEVITEPLHGSVYLAKPFDNPFGSLIAVYLTVEDPQTGIVAKLAGKVEPDPLTGQLSTKFTENPEQPLEDIRVHLFDGPRAGLQTPATCPSNVPYTTTTDLTPWSAPEGVDEHPESSFIPTTAPGGGPCPQSEAQMPNSPTFTAGTISPAAGAYSPLVMKLARQDGSQRLTRFDFTAPPGLSAKLAGVAECSEAQIARAQARSHPEEGALEKADPSCPTNSEVGVVDAGAGAGPTPLYVQGHVYLAGPYKGAPLSFVVITPAVAGPFDLGVVVTRAAVYLDSTTAQAHVVSDPFPAILDGIPLDLRSVAVKVGRPKFTLNPTSCDPKTFVGGATSVLGQIAPLSERFQAGGCKALPYKPKLHTRLFGPIHRGGHPRFRAVFEAKPGEANTARLVLALPHSEFIDQSHFRTICTRVQFAANQCPAGSIYGRIKAITPLLDYPLEGPIYLRSSSHELPDAVAALRGPPSQPLEVDVVGRVDSVNGGIRTTVETVPDAPLTKAVVTLQGAKKGLFQNSTNICKGVHRASLKLDGQNGKVSDSNPVMKADCPKAHKKGHVRNRG
jgi:hypothetical protein